MNARSAIVVVGSRLVAIYLAVLAGNAFAANTLADLDETGRKITKEKCAHPRKVVVERIKNRYEDVIDEIKTFSCAGYRVVAYEAHASGIVRELPKSVVLTSSISKFLPTFAKGMKANRVRELLGSPYSESEIELVYSLSEERPGEDTIAFRLVHGRVESIVWGWDVD